MSAQALNAEHNAVLDEILEMRRSIRAFKDEPPSREAIKQIIHAGVLAPYAALAVTSDGYFRRFFVVSNKSPATRTIAALGRQTAQTAAERLRKQTEKDPSLRDKASAFLQRLDHIARTGVPVIGAAPYYIVVAERKGVPASQQQSLAHCLQNMWLKATALGLGFQLVSLTAQLGESKEFCDTISLPIGEFEVNGCAIGYAKELPPPRSLPRIDDITAWIE
jgi:nitroreductase